MAVMRLTRRGLAAAAAATLAATVFGAGAALPASAAPAPAVGKILHADSPTAIPGSYIVSLKSDAGFASTSTQGKALAAKYGATVTHSYTAALKGYSIRLSPAQAARFAADPAVASVEQDQTFTIDATQTGATWGLDRIDQLDLPLDSSYTYPDTAGSGVTAYVIDTGVRITHTEFGGRASYGYDAVGDDFVAADGNGHGTHVAGTIAGTTYGVAKQAKIVAVRVLNNAGSGTTAGVIAGIDWTTANAVKPAVANMSLGGSASSSLDAAVSNSIASGITYAIAAGNSTDDASKYSPARVASAITVGATTSTDAVASYSNYGATVDIFAPGSSITSSWKTNDTSTNTISGTSMATPHVAGAAAVYLSGHPTASPAGVDSALKSGGTPNTLTGVTNGSPNLLLHIVP